MKILVPIKRVSDPEHANRVRLSPDSTQLLSEGLEWKINPYDEYALEAALRMNENGQTQEKLGETVVVGIGPKEARSTLGQALAMGADRGIHVLHESDSLDATVVARILAHLVQEEAPDLVMMGKLAVDMEDNACGQILAELLGWPMATQSQRIVTTPGSKVLNVGREVDMGEIVLELETPAVITCADRILASDAVKNGVTPESFAYPESEGGRYASLKGIMAAKKKPVTELELASLAVDLAPTLSYTHFEAAKTRQGTATLVSSAEELLTKLRHDAKVL
ncbi:MAG: electron transfer flavoprotein subunit beta/FixA family protein [Myxococcales bacterium]|nr:electron transfer flavoprotein subunit beta/FixA family protein [Myxococcales bacterium]MCB9707961.1 electron transfer flavoprotein subunit beta/FixA family protein [Myxococcales bacterium]